MDFNKSLLLVLAFLGFTTVITQAQGPITVILDLPSKIFNKVVVPMAKPFSFLGEKAPKAIRK